VGPARSTDGAGACIVNGSVTIRPFDRRDDLVALTALLHRSYAPLAAAGMHFVASHQSVATTRERVHGTGTTCLVAVTEAGVVVGTISVTGPRAGGVGYPGGPPWYQRPDVAVAGQYAVEPSSQGRGIGRRLLSAAVDLARDRGAAELACDTSERAADLITMYERRGFRHVDAVDWEETNYRSVVLSLNLNPDPVTLR